jgi:hypothetical protein
MLRFTFMRCSFELWFRTYKPRVIALPSEFTVFRHKTFLDPHPQEVPNSADCEFISLAHLIQGFANLRRHW